MKFKKLSEYLDSLEKINSRNEMTKILSKIYRELGGEQSSMFSYLVLGRVGPIFISSEFNVSEKSIIKLLKKIYPSSDIESVRAKLGDIGLGVYQLCDDRGDIFSLKEVYEILWSIVLDTGTGSSKRKLDTISHTISKLSKIEAKFFVKIIVGNLRLGVSIKTLIESLSIYVSESKKYSERIETAYGYSSDIGYLSRLIKESKDIDKELSNIDMIPGVPILPKLVQKVDSYEEGVKRMESDFYVQPKYDGLRCQIHKFHTRKKYRDSVWRSYTKKDTTLDMFTSNSNECIVKLYTRNLEDITEMFPEIVDGVKNIDCENIVLDSEIVGWNSAERSYLSYQDTMTRRRKYDVNIIKKSVPVNAFIFDVLFLNNTNCTKNTQKERIDILKNIDISKTKDIQLSPTDIISTDKELRELFNKYIMRNLEGVIIKKPNSVYSPGVRDYDWIKIKRSIENKLVDTLDLIVLGYFFGSGKRAQFGVGAILCGIYNYREDRFESFTKVGTGITDEQLKIIFERLEKIKVDKQPKNVVCRNILVPDVWVYPEVIVTVSADEISKNRLNSSIAKGYSLRFPRLVEWDRVDKQSNDIFKVEDL